MNDDTRAFVREWIERAEADWRTVRLLVGHRDAPPEIVCFHCQQYVEKLLKALLTARQVEAPRTHDLRALIELALPFAPDLNAFIDRVDFLSTCAVEIRYPLALRQLDVAEMREILKLAEALGQVILPALKV